MSDIFTTLFLDNPIYRWLIALLIALVILLIAQIFRMVIMRRLQGVKPYETHAISAFLISLAFQTRGYFILAAAVYLGARVLDFSAELDEFLKVIIITVTLLQFGFWTSDLIAIGFNRRIRQELERNNANATTLGGLSLVARVAVWGILILLILENVTGVQVNTLVTSLGITGIAVALAVQRILGDLFASLSITLDRPFVIGDFIAVENFMGVVEHIGLKSTRIRSLSGEQIVFSNSDLLGSRIRNYKRMMRRRAAFSFGVTYKNSPESSPDHIERILQMVKDIICEQAEVSFDRVHFKEIGASALVFEVVYHIETPDHMRYMDIQQAINLELLRRLHVEGMEIASLSQAVIERGNQQ